MSFPVKIRNARESDRPWIMATWLDANRRSPLSNYLTNTVYFGEHRKLITRILSCSVNLVAAWDKNNDQLFGWVCGDRIGNELIVHFIYTKQKFRRFGIAKKLMNELGYKEGETIVATHITYIYVETGIPRRIKIINNPYIAHRIANEA